MNFVTEPAPCIHPNAPMDEEQKAVAAEFVEELRDLGVLRPTDEDHPVYTKSNVCGRLHSRGGCKQVLLSLIMCWVPCVAHGSGKPNP